jgi:hypothetical protein
VLIILAGAVGVEDVDMSTVADVGGDNGFLVEIGVELPA